jgi:hypothetical protein
MDSSEYTNRAHFAVGLQWLLADPTFEHVAQDSEKCVVSSVKTVLHARHDTFLTIFSHMFNGLINHDLQAAACDAVAVNQRCS